MFDELMNEFIEEKNKMIDDCTRKLIEGTGLQIPEMPNTINMLLLAEDLRRLGYKIKWYNNSLVLVVLGDMCEDKVCGYEFSTKVEDNQVSFVAEPLEF